MSDRSSLTRSSLVVALSLAAACAGRTFFPPDSAVRPADTAPQRFNDAHMLVLTSAIVPMGHVPATAPGGATGSRSAAPPPCRPLIVDPETGTQLRLVRSNREARGDYSVPGGHYGLNANELLRVDCRTNRTIGIVPAH